jgi:Reverse transcriptase (RNA-dependent DNA polymerase)
VEHIFVLVKINFNYILIGNVYFPPLTDISIYNKHFEIINNLLLSYPFINNIILVGDYNFPKFQWLPSSIGFSPNLFNLSKTELNFLLKISYLNIFQFNDVVNSNGSILDLVFSDFNNISVNNSVNPLVPCDNYHPGLLVSIPIIVNKPIDYSLCVYNFHTCNYVDIATTLAAINWCSLFKNLNLNDAVNMFYCIIYEIIDIFVPKVIKRQSNYPLWYSKNLKDLIFKKKIAHKLYKSTGLVSDYNIFSELRAKCKFFSKKDYQYYIYKIQKNLKSYPTQFWKFINNKRKSNFLPNYMHLHNEQFDTPNDIINAFAKYFSSVYENHNSININDTESTIPPKVLLSPIHSISINLIEVFEALSSLNSNSSPGSDLLPSVFLKNCKFVISQPLLFLFNLSLSTGIFPDAWKTSFIRPIPKSQDLSNISNYRSISLLSLIPKIFESIVSNKILPDLNNVIIDDQHGFRRNRSTTTNLLIFHNFVSDALSAGSSVDVIYTDFAKAFDKVNHQILFKKLKEIGICGVFLSWLISFIEDRYQIVAYQEHWSIPIRVTSGVPQGSHLAPILFLIFINDISFQNCSKLMFADDIKIFRKVNSQIDADMLQFDLDILYEWCTYNYLTLNINKCQIMTFSRARVVSNSNYFINGELLPRSMGPIKDLGILFDPKLKFDCHINNIVNRSHKILGFIIRNCADFTDKYALKSIYCSLVRSICEYGSIIWSPYQSGHKSRLEKVQQKFLRFLSFKCSIPREPHSSYAPLLSILNLETLEQRRLRLDLYFLYKLLSGNIDCPNFLSQLSFLTPVRITRSKYVFHLKKQVTNYAGNTPCNRIMKTVNELEIDLFISPNLYSFKIYCNFLLCNR